MSNNNNNIYKLVYKNCDYLNGVCGKYKKQDLYSIIEHNYKDFIYSENALNKNCKNLLTDTYLERKLKLLEDDVVDKNIIVGHKGTSLLSYSSIESIGDTLFFAASNKSERNGNLIREPLSFYASKDKLNTFIQSKSEFIRYSENINGNLFVSKDTIYAWNYMYLFYSNDGISFNKTNLNAIANNSIPAVLPDNKIYINMRGNVWLADINGEIEVTNLSTNINFMEFHTFNDKVYLFSPFDKEHIYMSENYYHFTPIKGRFPSYKDPTTSRPIYSNSCVFIGFLSNGQQIVLLKQESIIDTRSDRMNTEHIVFISSNFYDYKIIFHSREPTLPFSSRFREFLSPNISKAFRNKCRIVKDIIFIIYGFNDTGTYSKDFGESWDPLYLHNILDIIEHNGEILATTVDGIFILNLE